MRRLVPDTVAGRTFLVLVVGLVLSHIASIAFYATDRANSLDVIDGAHIAERMATLARLIEHAGPEQRKEIARLASRESMTVSLGEEGLVTSEPGSRHESVVRRSFLQHLSDIGVTEFFLRIRESDAIGAVIPSSGSAPANASYRRLSASMRLSDGSWLNFITEIQDPDDVWSFRFSLSLAVMLLAIVLISAVIVRHVNRPLHLFAKAAQRIGRDVSAAPMAATGPREVREVIAAFNKMQARIRRLVDDRTQMLTAISHDLRTPITLLRLRAEFVDDETERARMLNALDEMEAMITAVLAFARDDGTKEIAERVDLRALVSTICNDMADAGLPVEFVNGPRVVIACRRHSVARATTNLIDNAVKYGERAVVRLEQRAGEIAIVVEDVGPGIPDDQMAAATRPFVRLDDARSGDQPGTGLGLSIARSMAIANGGTLVLENRSEGGLRATIRLPDA